MKPQLPVVFALAFSLLLASFAVAQDEKLPMLLKRSPSQANAMGYVNVKAINELMSDAGFADRVSDSVDEFWFISDLNLMNLRPKWEAGYATLEQSVNAEDLAARVGGYVDTLNGQDVVWSPTQTYLYPGKENRLGVLRPADRSLLSGWLLSSGDVHFSPYLESHANQPESYLSMMLAVQVANVFSPVPLAERLKEFTSLKSNSPDSVAKILASAVGMNIIVGRRSLNECILTIDFAKSPASLKAIANELFAEMLERSGSAAPEVLSWKVKIEGNQMTMKGPIGEATLNGLLGIFSLEDEASRTVRLTKDGGSQGKTEQEQVGYRSKNYFDQVNAIVEQTRKHKSKTTGALAKWNDQRARQIDELGTLKVDPEMVQYGTNVSETLRGNALTVRQGNIDAGKVKASQSLNNGYYGNGYYDANSSTDYQAVTTAYASGNAYADYQSALNQIDKLMAETRRKMTSKYSIQF